MILALVAVGAAALTGLLASNHLDIQLLRKRTDSNSATIDAILRTLQDQEIIENLKFGA